MLKKKNRHITNQAEIISINQRVPENHLLTAVESNIDFDFIYDEVMN